MVVEGWQQRQLAVAAVQTGLVEGPLEGLRQQRRPRDWWCLASLNSSWQISVAFESSRALAIPRLLCFN